MASRLTWTFVVPAMATLLALPTLFTPDFCLDDSFIHLAYVKSIRLGQGVSYNPYDWETGISSPLWVALLSLWPSGVPSVFAVKLLGALLHASSAVVLTSLARAVHPDGSNRFPILAGLLWAASPLALQGATSGMEVPLACLLALLTVHAAVLGRGGLAAACAALAYLARPELLVFSLLVALALWLVCRDLRAMPAVAGALAGLLAFWSYCFAVSGHAWPNTYYVKGANLDLAGLRYLALEVIMQDPVVLSLAGLGLCGWAVHRAQSGRRELLALGIAAVGTLLATALSRKLYPGVRFFQSRYFVIVLWILPLFCAYGLSELRAKLAWAFTLPLAAAYLYAVSGIIDLQLAQERGVRNLHVEPALHIARSLPSTRVLGVEGAGALRFLTPRSVQVVDLVGLNDRALAHSDGLNFFGKLCHLLERGVTHLAYPGQWRARMHQAFMLDDLASFTERKYAQIEPPGEWQVLVAAVRKPRANFASYCASLRVKAMQAP